MKGSRYMTETYKADIIVGKMPQAQESGQIQLLHLPDEFGWLRHFEARHIAQFFSELLDALRHSLETGDWTGISEVIENWKATAEIEASSELREAIATGAEQLAADDAVHWSQLQKNLGL
jgi:hypothetical protein